MLIDYSMDNRDIAAFDIVYDDVADVDGRFPVGKDEEVAAVENRFHTSR